MAIDSSASGSPYLLLFRNAEDDPHRRLTPEQRTQLTQKWNGWVESLVDRDKLIEGHPLGLSGRTISGERGQHVVDGPYAEAKELVGGFIMINTRDLDEATEIAKGCPGLAVGLTVEVRPVIERSQVLEGVRAYPRG